MRNETERLWYINRRGKREICDKERTERKKICKKKEKWLREKRGRWYDGTECV